MTLNEANRDMMIAKEIRSTIKSNIENYGWHMAAIFPKVSDEGLPFCYTVGLTDQDLPEIIMIGSINPRNAHVIFSLLIQSWKENGFKAGLNDSLIQDHSGKALTVDIAELDAKGERLRGEYALQTFCHYGKNSDKVRFVQIHWPDERGNLPSSPDFAMGKLTEVLPEIKTVKFDA